MSYKGMVLGLLLLVASASAVNIQEDEQVSINNRQLREIITEVLTDTSMHSDAAVELLMLTAATESHLGTYLKQVGNGPAQGIFQMEPDTEADILQNYVAFRHRLKFEVDGFTTGHGKDLRDNLAYQIIMARIHYMRVPESLPEATDVEGLARYWKKYYNTHLGKGVVEEAVANYQRLCT